MPHVLLTIIIPTFNRQRHLFRLLDSLACELQGHEGRVVVIIGDNASSDETPSVVSYFQAKYASTIALRHPENIGADENFCRCIELVKSRYFWIIGDDDLPKRGVLSKIVNLLQEEDVDILYLNSEWLDNIVGPDDGVKILDLKNKEISRVDFAARVNVWVTFLSGVVVNLECLQELDPKFDLRRFCGTGLVQLGWVLPILMSGNKFQIVVQRCILATSGNSGGYKLFHVFGNSFPRILAEICRSNSYEYKIIMNFLCWSYIPRLIWMVRFGGQNNFDSKDILGSIVSLRNTWAYWIVIIPLSFLSRPFAYPFLYLVELVEKFLIKKNNIYG